MLGREGRRGNVVAASLFQAFRPPALGIGLLRRQSQYRARTVDQKCAQIDIPALADPARTSGSDLRDLRVRALKFCLRPQVMHLDVEFTQPNMKGRPQCVP